MDLTPEAKRSEEASMNMMLLMRDLQARNVVDMFNSISERCFRLCVKEVDDDRPIDNKEDTCLKNCAEKWQKVGLRVQINFMEENARATTRADLLRESAARKEEDYTTKL